MKIHETDETPCFSASVATTIPLKRLTLIVLSVLGLAATGTAAEQAKATLTATPLGGGEFDYTLSLDNTGTTNLETFWYAWVPGEDFMPVSPTGIQSPVNWSANITGGGSNNGFAIQWLTSSSGTPAPLTPGHSFTFSFDSTATPTVMAGDSPFYPTTPIGTSFVYTGAPFSDAGFELAAASVAPEPSSLLLATLASIGLWHAVRRQAKAA